MPKTTARQITVPDTCLVMLVGASNSGKSTFARRHFLPSEIVSSDHYREVVSNTQLDMSASGDAFKLVHQIVDYRLKRGLLTVVDSTNVVREHRKQLMDIARRNYVETIALVLDTPLSTCLNRAANRTEHPIPPDVVRNHHQQLQRDLRRLHRFVKSEVITHDEIVQINRRPMAVDLKHLSGPFNIIGDVHGCYDELLELLKKLPEGLPVFLGDLADRGPNSPAVIRLVCDLVDRQEALWCPGNHDNKLYRYLMGNNVTISHGLQDTIDQIGAMPESEQTQLIEDFKRIFKSLPSHYVLDGGKLVVAHAGLPESMHGRDVKGVYSTAMYGETTNKQGDLPDRIDWAADYRGSRLVVYGHSAYQSPRWLNNTVNIDTGCVFGGCLTALAYPINETISVPAKQVYHAYGNPLPDPVGDYDDVLDISDVSGRKNIHTRHDGVVRISDWKATAAFETMVTAGIDPRLMIYLPPTMSPCETSSQEGYLEHPEEAVQYFAKRGVDRVVFEEKHMGSRAIALICRDEQAALRRFGIQTLGTVYTRTGRPFFDGNEQLALVESLHADLTLANVWEQYDTDWILLDGELMPWSAKAGGLLTRTYASTAMAGKHLSSAAATELATAANRLDDANLRNDLNRWDRLQGHMEKFRNAYLNYCWKVNSVSDLMYAPFALLATEGRTHFHVPHVQQMRTFADWRGRIISHTNFVEVEVDNRESVDQAIQFWIRMTEAGGEGMVIKPYNPITKFDNRIVQPGIKCRGREYLRIIYGPDYTDNLDRLRRRNLSGKRANAAREYALGIEGLARFVVREPLRRVHECVFGVLALESEPVDPRL